MTIVNRWSGCLLGLALISCGASTALAQHDAIGAASEVQDLAFRFQPAGAPVGLQRTDPVLLYDTVETPSDALARIIFLDESTVTVGPNAELYIDEFIYDPSSGVTTMVGRLASGAFRFASGNSEHRNSVIETPSATLGIRGTEFYVNVLEDGSVALLVDDGGVLGRHTTSANNLPLAAQVGPRRFAIYRNGSDQIFTGPQEFMDSAFQAQGYNREQIIDERVIALSNLPIDTRVLAYLICPPGAGTEVDCGPNEEDEIEQIEAFAPPPLPPLPPTFETTTTATDSTSTTITTGSDGSRDAVTVVGPEGQQTQVDGQGGYSVNQTPASGNGNNTGMSVDVGGRSVTVDSSGNVTIE